MGIFNCSVTLKLYVLPPVYEPEFPPAEERHSVFLSCVSNRNDFDAERGVVGPLSGLSEGDPGRIWLSRGRLKANWIWRRQGSNTQIKAERGRKIQSVRKEANSFGRRVVGKVVMGASRCVKGVVMPEHGGNERTGLPSSSRGHLLFADWWRSGQDRLCTDQTRVAAVYGSRRRPELVVGMVAPLKAAARSEWVPQVIWVPIEKERATWA